MNLVFHAVKEHGLLSGKRTPFLYFPFKRHLQVKYLISLQSNELCPFDVEEPGPLLGKNKTWSPSRLNGWSSCSFVMLLCLTAVTFSNLSAVWQHNDRLLLDLTLWLTRSCLMKSRICLPFASTWVHACFFFRSVLLLLFLVFCVVLYFIFFSLLVFVLRLLCAMLSVLLDYSFLIAFSSVYLACA